MVMTKNAVKNSKEMGERPIVVFIGYQDKSRVDMGRGITVHSGEGGKPIDDYARGQDKNLAH